MPATDDRSLRADRGLLLEAVADAGELAKSLFDRGVKSWRKSDETPVTEADIAVDALLRRKLAGNRPDYGWLSEETRDDPARRNRSRVWIVDPIDGTRGFVRGTDQWCVAAALVEDGVPLLGVVVNPVRRETFEAVRGGGAFCNGEPLAASAPDMVSGCHLIMHASLLHSGKWTRPWPDDVTVSMRTSMALRLCHVAAGRADGAVVVSGKADWDLAAADLMVKEAGGRVTDLNGAPVLYNRREPRHFGVVGAGAAFHGRLLEYAGGWMRET